MVGNGFHFAKRYSQTETSTFAVKLVAVVFAALVKYTAVVVAVVCPAVRWWRIEVNHRRRSVNSTMRLGAIAVRSPEMNALACFAEPSKTRFVVGSVDQR